MEILGSEIKTNMTLFDVYEQSQGSTAGGVHAKSSLGLTMYQNVWHVYKLERSYSINDVSCRLQFDLYMSEVADFIGICLTKELHGYEQESGRRPSCIHLFGPDLSWGDSNLSVIPFNLALWKPTKQNSYLAPYESKNAADGDHETFMFTELTQNPQWEVDLEGRYTIGQIVLYKNTDPAYTSMDDFSSIVVTAYNEMNRKVYQSLPFTISNDIHILDDLPPNTVASRVVVSVSDDKKRILSLKEVEIYFPTDSLKGRKIQLDIPIGSYFSGDVNYLTLVQGSKISLSSYISDFKFSFKSRDI